MDIHPPSGPTHSFKDFAIHILIVTIGILIAFGLEGVREAWRENKAVSEARASMREELRANQDHLKLELAAVKAADAQLQRVIADLPEMAKKPDDLRKQVTELNLPGYFFKTTAWDSALASGVLSHMDGDELHRFDEAYQGVKTYQEMQKAAQPDWLAVNAYFGSHPTFNSPELALGEEKLRVLQKETQISVWVGEQFAAGLKYAIGEPSPAATGK